jgi:hypothetical protein
LVERVFLSADGVNENPGVGNTDIVFVFYCL